MYKTLPLLLPLLLPLGACGAGDDDGNAADADAGVGCATEYYADTDGDGYGDEDSSMQACEAPTGFVAQGGDCDDSSAAINPDGAEVCDGSDNDCDGLTDSADPDIDLATERAYYIDNDNDGYGEDSSTMTSCDQPAGYSANNTDCDDSRSEVNPGETEICDGLDNDCDTLADDADDSLDTSTAESFYSDADGDGYGVGSAVVACEAPPEHAIVDGDCDDAESAANPGESEICDGLDNDCDGGNDGTPQAPNQCAAYEGSYSGSYSIRAQEKIGSTVINDMPCNGTASVTIDLAASPAVQGTVTCTRSGGLILFDSTQTGTISGDIALDGSLDALLRHTYNSDLVRSYSFDGPLLGDDMNITGSGSLLPHPMSAVPWEVNFSVDASR